MNGVNDMLNLKQSGYIQLNDEKSVYAYINSHSGEIQFPERDTELHKQEVYILSGVSGSGKSYTMRQILKRTSNATRAVAIIEYLSIFLNAKTGNNNDSSRGCLTVNVYNSGDQSAYGFATSLIDPNLKGFGFDTTRGGTDTFFMKMLRARPIGGVTGTRTGIPWGNIKKAWIKRIGGIVDSDRLFNEFQRLTAADVEAIEKYFNADTDATIFNNQYTLHLNNAASKLSDDDVTNDDVTNVDFTILDMPGFETFDENKMTQLLFNAANERSLQLFASSFQSTTAEEVLQTSKKALDKAKPHLRYALSGHLAYRSRAERRDPFVTIKHSTGTNVLYDTRATENITPGKTRYDEFNLMLTKHTKGKKMVFVRCIKNWIYGANEVPVAAGPTDTIAPVSIKEQILFLMLELIVSITRLHEFYADPEHVKRLENLLREYKPQFDELVTAADLNDETRQIIKHVELKGDSKKHDLAMLLKNLEYPKN